MDNFVFSSRLKLSYRSRVEQLIFFNPLQARYRSKIIEAVETFGNLLIVQEGQWLRVALDKGRELQTIFLLSIGRRDELLGFLSFVRPVPDELLVIHVAVRSIDNSPSDASAFLMLKMINKLRESACSIKGIERIRLFYDSNSKGILLWRLRIQLWSAMVKAI